MSEKSKITVEIITDNCQKTADSLFSVVNGPEVSEWEVTEKRPIEDTEA